MNFKWIKSSGKLSLKTARFEDTKENRKNLNGIFKFQIKKKSSKSKEVQKYLD